MPRYIDADELRRRVKEKTNPYGKPTLDYESGVKVLNMIDNAPTADVQEVRHGCWITKDLDNFRKIECKCSECGYIGISNYDSYDDPYDFNYCPNCGALMDGKEDEAKIEEIEEKK